MSSTFDHYFAASGWAYLLAQHGRAITWTVAPGATAESLTAIVGEENQATFDTDAGEQNLRARVVELSLADVANPARGGVATIDGEEWSYHATLWRREGMAGVRVVRPETAELSQRDYRQPQNGR